MLFPDFLYFRPILHAPATAGTQLSPTRRYAPSTAPCPVPPLKGLRGNRAHSLSYRAFAPAGADDLDSRPTANYSLLTANSTVAPPAPPVPLIQHSTFSIQHWTYTFSAKEKDSETGLSYFGSRYYSSDLGIWLSVDPMASKYPSLSPYVYCADNPVKLVDPDGEEYGIPPWYPKTQIILFPFINQKSPK